MGTRAPGLRSTWGDGLLVAVSGVMVLYLSYVGLHLLDGTDRHAVALAWVDGLSGVVAVLVLVLLLSVRPDRGGRLVLSALMATAAGGNAVAHVSISQDLTNTVLVVIVLIVVAAGITASPLAAGLVLALWLGWFAATVGLRGDPEWLRHVSDLAVATLAGFLLHVGRRTTVLTLLRAQAELERLTERDDLTGLANRRGFFAVMRRAVARAETDPDHRLVVLYCDVDGLKQVNDTRGHEAGDALLVTVADRLRAEFVDAEVVGRLGGDEFGVVLHATGGPHQVEEAAERARGIRDDSVEAVWSLSVGAASSDELAHHGPHGGPGSAPRPGAGVPGAAAGPDRTDGRGPTVSHVWPGRDLVGAVVGLADARMYAAKRSRPGRHHG